jgi:hypothetical protein
MIRYKRLKLCHGPQFVTAGVYFVAWVVYGLTTKQLIFTVPGYLALICIYLWSYLVLSKQYAMLVYQNVILINASWYIRQYGDENLYNGCILATYIYYISPLFALYKSITNKDVHYLSLYNIIFGLLESIFFLAFLYFNI